MPLYEFRTSDGDVVERFYPMSESPEIGAVIEDAEWGKITRLPSNSPRRDIVRDYHNVAHSLPKIHDGRAVAKRRRAEAARATDPAEREALLESASDWERSKPIWHKTDAKGHPVFETARDVREFQERTGHRYRWDQG